MHISDFNKHRKTAVSEAWNKRLVGNWISIAESNVKKEKHY